jgi:hypothetical protein
MKAQITSEFLIVSTTCKVFINNLSGKPKKQIPPITSELNSTGLFAFSQPNEDDELFYIATPE